MAKQNHPDSCSNQFEQPRDSGGVANAKASILRNARMPAGSVGHVGGGSTPDRKGGVRSDDPRSRGAS